jgi:ABC-type sugar transport system substrate-binding protein
MKKLVIFFLISANSFAQKIPKVYFVSPEVKYSENKFWATVHDNVIQAAKDLNINLEMVYTKTHHSYYYKAIKDLEKRKKEDLPDYFIGLPYIHHGKEILNILSKLNIKIFFINMTIEDKRRPSMGFPRGKYKGWIGHFYPDDYNAGALITKEVAKVCNAENGVVGLAGNHMSSASILRQKAFQDGAKKFNLKLYQVFQAEWQKDVVMKMMPNIEKRYPNTCGFLSASDGMAEGVLISSSKKYQICGIDWTERALKKIVAGEILCSAGGHFLEPAFALVAVFDYHNGIDFKDDIGLTYKTPFFIATKINASQILEKFFRGKQILTYKKYSKFYTKKTSYNFSIH